jgi:hypothetical protein
MKRIRLNWIAIALLSLTLAACASPLASVTPSTTPAGEIDTLDEARAAWASSGINNYDFTITRQCFCMEEYAGPFTVRVRDGVSTVTRSSDGSEVDPLVLNLLPLSAEELFQFAEERQEQASFRVTYDQATGLPLSVWSDPIPEAADDELGVLVSGFTAAP